MDTDFAPTGEARLRQILDAVVAEGDAAEHLGLEAKSDIDPSKKGVGIAKIAKFILGTSNRMPEVAAGHFKGYGVMVIGAETQLPIYLKGEKAEFGIYLCIGYRDRDFEEERLTLVTSACGAISEQGKTRIVPVFVDARPKKSASKA